MNAHDKLSPHSLPMAAGEIQSWMLPAKTAADFAPIVFPHQRIGDLLTEAFRELRKIANDERSLRSLVSIIEDQVKPEADEGPGADLHASVLKIEMYVTRQIEACEWQRQNPEAF
jgi:hypothetical protein